MPDVKDKTVTPEPLPAPRKSLLPANTVALLVKVATYGLIGLVAIFAAFLISTKVLKPMLSHSPAPAQEQAPELKPVAEPEVKAEVKVEKSEKSEHGEEGEKGEGAGGESNFYSIESIVVNPAGTGGTRYLSCGVSFELADAEEVKTFEAKSVQIKDILITILSSKTVDELADIKLRNQMRRQILAIVNRFMAPSRAKAVFLTDFVLQ
jgi:flagellar FliL protein